MENQLAKTENNLQPISDNQLIEYLETMGLAKELTTAEKNSFLQIAKAFNLNPFKREIYCSKYAGQTSIITGYEVYIKRAERSGVLDGWEVTTSGNVTDESLKATITIHRKDRKYPFKHEVLYSEYVQKTKEGNVTKFWKKAFTMTKKVAIAQGFRLCFSDELGGMPYTQDEIHEDVSHEIVSSKVISPKVDEQKELLEKYLGLINDSSHVFSSDEKDIFSKNKKGVPVEQWNTSSLKEAIIKIETLISDRENALMEEDIKRQNDIKS